MSRPAKLAKDSHTAATPAAVPQACPFLELPVELYSIIYDSLALRETLSLSYTCRSFFGAINGDVLKRCCSRLGLKPKFMADSALAHRQRVLAQRGIACYECNRVLYASAPMTVQNHRMFLYSAPGLFLRGFHHPDAHRLLCGICARRLTYITSTQAQKKYALSRRDMLVLRASHTTKIYMFGDYYRVAVYWIDNVKRLALEKQAQQARIQMQKDDAQAQAVLRDASRASKAQQRQALSAQAAAQAKATAQAKAVAKAEKAQAPAPISSSERAELDETRRGAINDIVVTVRQEHLVEALKALGISTNADTWRSPIVTAYLAGRWLELAPLGIEDATGVAAHLFVSAGTTSAGT